jgi:acyl carrier protein
MDWHEKIAALSPDQREKLSQRLGLTDSVENAKPKLVAYYVKEPEQADISNKELRAYLEERVTMAMLPTHFVVLTHFPETISGKLDRKSLPAPDWTGTSVDAELLPAANEYESGLIKIWEEVLNVEPISVEDDFFSMGGDSLLAIRIIARIRKTYDIAMTPREIFETPTLRELATEVARQSAPDDGYEEFEL